VCAQRGDDNVLLASPTRTIQGPQHDPSPAPSQAPKGFLLFNPEPGWKADAAPTSAIAPSATFTLPRDLARRLRMSRLDRSSAPPQS